MIFIRCTRCNSPISLLTANPLFPFATKRCYGIAAWTTTYHERLLHSSYVSHTRTISNQSYVYRTFTSELSLASYENCTFSRVSFTNIELRHLSFHRCRFEQCRFIDVVTANVSFTETNITRSLFSGTDLCDHDFRRSYVRNNTFMYNRSRCAVASKLGSGVGGELAVEDCFVKMAALPAAAVYVMAVDHVGRSKLLGTVDQSKLAY